MSRILFWACVVAVAGFLFGFDTAVISGADKPIQALWQTSPIFHGVFVMSSALWGTVLGALFGNIPTDRLGRKFTLVIIGFLYLFSALGSALAQDPYTFAIMRFIGGIGVGISSIAAPAYIAEIAPAKYRGRLVALYQFQIVFGILVAFFSNYLISGISNDDWRWMLGIEVLPAIAFISLILIAPESPRWLVLHGQQNEKALSVFESLGHTKAQALKLVTQIVEHSTHSDRLLSKKHLPLVMLVFLIAMFNQLSGINFIIYYAPRVFELAGLDTSASLLSTAGIGITNLIFTMLGMYLIDKAGRKKLLYIGSVGYIISLVMVALGFNGSIDNEFIVVFVFSFIASHAVGQGAVIWVFIAEIFPNAIRSKGQSIGSGTHWVFAAIITLVMPYFLSNFLPAQIFTFFAVAMFFQLLFVYFLMPETKGRTLEQTMPSVFSKD
ncbi:sugar porter family MFS transporter [Aliiglaciecola sp. NS0011-25]|uniref:sugar porter family MFS transporter n=1 Tax=Aliiglaciecola sp. NS0011-25 TaxID=3127654 RepID=UPI00310818C4